MKKSLVIVSLLLLVGLSLGAQEKRYGIKSGIVKQQMELLGQLTETVTYFDDYGAIQAADVTVAGNKVRTVSKDGNIYTIQDGKVVQKMAIPESVNYLNLTDDVVAKYKVAEAGKDKVCGKSCIKYTQEATQMGQTVKMTVSVWEGIPLKTITDVAGMKIVLETTEVVENATMPAGIFDIPE